MDAILITAAVAAPWVIYGAFLYCFLSRKNPNSRFYAYRDDDHD